MTTRARLAETAAQTLSDLTLIDDAPETMRYSPLTYGDARKLLALVEAAQGVLAAWDDKQVTIGMMDAAVYPFRTALTALTTDPDGRDGH